MSSTLKEIADAAPITSTVGTDLVYLSRSPYTSGLDRGISTTNLFASPQPIGATAPSTASFTSVQTLTTAANTLLIQAYDVDGAAYKTFGTLTAANTPSLAFSQPSGGTLTWNGGTIGLSQAAAANFTDVQAIRIGNVSPGTGVFSNLSWPTRQELISINTIVDPDTDLCSMFVVDTSGVVISAEVLTNYDEGFQFWIKNVSSGTVTFQPNAADNIDSATSLDIGINESYQISKSLISNKWITVANYDTPSNPPPGSNFLAINSNATILPNYTYYCTNGGSTYIALRPSDTFNLGDTVKIIGAFAGDNTVGRFQIAPNTGQMIYWLTNQTTVTNFDNQGYIDSNLSGQVIELTYVSSNTFHVTDVVGDNFIIG